MSVVFPCVFFLSRLLCFLYLFPYFVSSLFFYRSSFIFILAVHLHRCDAVLADGEAVATVAQ